LLGRGPYVAVFQAQHLLDVGPQGLASSLLKHRPGAVPPQVDILGNNLLAGAQLFLLYPELVAVLASSLEELLADLL
jgi:hypothetical protein